MTHNKKGMANNKFSNFIPKSVTTNKIEKQKASN